MATMPELAAQLRLRRLMRDHEVPEGNLSIPTADVAAMLTDATRFGAELLFATSSGQRHCVVCGCTTFRACPGGCAWVAEDLCSTCT